MVLRPKLVDHLRAMLPSGAPPLDMDSPDLLDFYVAGEAAVKELVPVFVAEMLRLRCSSD